MVRQAWVVVALGVLVGGCVATAEPGIDPASGLDPSESEDGSGSQSGSGEGDGSTSGEGSGSGDGEAEGTGEPLPPFSCDAPAAESPVLDGLVLLDPADPHPGDTLTVIVRATNGLSRGDAPPMALEVTGRDGVQSFQPQAIEGGQVLYYFAIPDVPEGDVCLRGIIDGATEITGKVTVTPRPPGPVVAGGIYKVVSNHQWTCDEQPGWGNELHVWVRDENGQGMPDVAVSLRPADTTDLGTIYNGEGEPLPERLVTGADGHAMTYVYWPISDNGLLVFEVAIDGLASDIATEITTGWWEDDLMGCNYCNTPTINVWGHWSYTVEFQRDPGATEICVVENDHAGMGACGEPRHIHHHPDVRACWVP
jgi:hypothetical protein